MTTSNDELRQTAPLPARVVLLAGTRPEAVKIAPVALALSGHPTIRPVIVHSGQHGAMVHQALEPFGLEPHVELDIDRRSGTQAELAAALLPALDELLVDHRPAVMLVQGDTTTALTGALAAFWRGVPIAHLEAGLRTGDLGLPFPEEGNRQMIARIASLHLAPTPAAANALALESVPRETIAVTGNTVVDAVQYISSAELPPKSTQLAVLERVADAHNGRLMLVTVHRRESWGAPLDRILGAVSDIVEQHDDLFAVLPVHPNPVVAGQVHQRLGGHPRIGVMEPLDYPDLIRVLQRADLVLTDSGGIQEEAPTFGVPVLVCREVTERFEAVHAGCAWLVGSDIRQITTAADRLLSSGYRYPPDRNPYGDGKAGLRAADELERLIELTSPHSVCSPQRGDATPLAS